MANPIDSKMAVTLKELECLRSARYSHPGIAFKPRVLLFFSSFFTVNFFFFFLYILINWVIWIFISMKKQFNWLEFNCNLIIFYFSFLTINRLSFGLSLSFPYQIVFFTLDFYCFSRLFDQFYLLTNDLINFLLIFS